MALTEKELQESFATKVIAPRVLVNYQALETALVGINAEIKKEIFPHRREKLFKIRRNIKTILKDL